MAPIKGEYLD